jgi:hypothetical protein
MTRIVKWLASVAVLLASGQAVVAQEKLLSANVDMRTLVAFKVSDAVISKLLPAGWEADVPTNGPTAGANLNITLVENMSVQNAEGQPREPNRVLSIGIPAKKTGGDIKGRMTVGGLASPKAAPGTYGVFAPAAITVDRKFRVEPSGVTTIEEAWDFKSDNGDTVQIQLQFTRGQAERRKMEANTFSATKPEIARLYKFEHAADVVRSVATNVDRVKNWSFRATGPNLRSIFDGTEQVIAITSVPWYSRRVYVPGS